MASLSRPRLYYTHRVLSGYIEHKDMPGLVALVAGGFGTTTYTDPAEGMTGILFTQRMMDSSEPPRVFTDFWTLAYTAMDQAGQ